MDSSLLQQQAWPQIIIGLPVRTRHKYSRAWLRIAANGTRVLFKDNPPLRLSDTLVERALPKYGTLGRGKPQLGQRGVASARPVAEPLCERPFLRDTCARARRKQTNSSRNALRLLTLPHKRIATWLGCVLTPANGQQLGWHPRSTAIT